MTFPSNHHCSSQTFRLSTCKRARKEGGSVGVFPAFLYSFARTIQKDVLILFFNTSFWIVLANECRNSMKNTNRSTIKYNNYYVLANERN